MTRTIRPAAAIVLSAAALLAVGCHSLAGSDTTPSLISEVHAEQTAAPAANCSCEAKASIATVDFTCELGAEKIVEPSSCAESPCRD